MRGKAVTACPAGIPYCLSSRRRYIGTPTPLRASRIDDGDLPIWNSRGLPFLPVFAAPAGARRILFQRIVNPVVMVVVHVFMEEPKQVPLVQKPDHIFIELRIMIKDRIYRQGGVSGNASSNC
jgi:hypothetical protein